METIVRVLDDFYDMEGKIGEFGRGRQCLVVVQEGHLVISQRPFFVIRWSEAWGVLLVLEEEAACLQVHVQRWLVVLVALS